MRTRPLDVAPASAGEVAAIERWFLRRGTPHLIEDYTASEDILTRLAPWFALVVLVEAASVFELDLRWWQNTLFVLAGAALVVGAYAVLNLVRQRPALGPPDDVGVAEVALFVFGPAVPPLLLNDRPGQALVVVVVNVVLLGLAFVVASYGLVPLTRWAVGRMVRELGAFAGLVARALPLLALFVTFLFVNAEVWQVAETMEAPFLAATTGLFVVLGGLFLVTRLPGELQALARFDDAAEVVALCAGSPAATAARAAQRDGRLDAVDRPLTRRQRVNLSLVVVFSQAVQVTLVALAIAAFFVGFGLLAVRPEAMASWVGEAALDEALVRLEPFGHEVLLTPALLRVAAFLGAFSGFYFAIYTVTDATYREQFRDDVVGEVRQTFAVRAAYLALVAHGAGNRSGPDGVVPPEPAPRPPQVSHP